VRCWPRDHRDESGCAIASPGDRADASGDTFIFTQFLDFSAQTWDDKIGYGTPISWPVVEGEKVTTGNDGVVQAVTVTPYAVGYVGISFRKQVAKASLGRDTEEATNPASEG
jgi:phosphate transport system substrate-binding protein